MKFAEVISGDGEHVYRERIDLSETGAFGQKSLARTIELKGAEVGSRGGLGQSRATERFRNPFGSKRWARNDR